MLAWRVSAATSLIRFTAKAPPTSDTHHTRGRCFNAEKANLFSGINNHLDLARISLFAFRFSSLVAYNPFTAKALPTSDIHYTRGRRFNAEKVNLFSDIKQPSPYSSYLVIRSSLPITLSRLKPLLQVIYTSHVGGVLTPKNRTFSAILNTLHGLARISLFVTRCLLISLLVAY